MSQAPPLGQAPRPPQSALAQLLMGVPAYQPQVSAMGEDELKMQDAISGANQAFQYAPNRPPPGLQFSPSDPSRLGPQNEWAPDFNGFQGKPDQQYPGFYWLRKT